MIGLLFPLLIERVIIHRNIDIGMRRPIKLNDLNNYVSRFEEYPDHIHNVNDNGIVYEALCETIVEINPDYDVKSIGEEFEGETEDEAKSFIMDKFETVVADELWHSNILNVTHRNKWTDSVLESFYEHGFL